MDFVTALSRSQRKNNAVWVIVDCLMKSTYFIPFKLGQSTELLVEKYIQEVVRLYGVPVSVCPTETLYSSPTFGEVSKKA